MIDRSDIGIGAVIAAVLAGGLAIVCSVQLAIVSPARDNLDHAYPGKQVRITTLHTSGAESVCGYYQPNGSGPIWRYLEAREGLWAEGLAKKSWESMASSPGSDHSLAQRWRNCMAAGGRGHQLDWIVDPLVVRYLNATKPSSS